ncbi:MAG: alpha-glucosidase/alpha-galactosidase [Kiritimatiellia bacterium]
MPKITFMGAGSTVFAKNVIGDCMCTPSLRDSHFALYDIDAVRLRESRTMLSKLNRNINGNRATITAHLGAGRRRTALRGADYVINAVQVGGYDPATIIDFEVPAKFGLRQTIGDTLGIGGIFRALRSIPVLLDFAKDMEAVCPDAVLLNYSNPMAMLTGALLGASDIRTVGLCHSVQGCAEQLLKKVGMLKGVTKLQWKIAGINHQGWLLEITDDGKDLYPEIKKRAARMNRDALKKGGKKHNDMVRFEIMKRFGYYVTESSEHSAEYMPYWIKSKYPGLIGKYNIPLDEYPRRCIRQIEAWKERRKGLVGNSRITHKRTHEYASGILEAMETGVAFTLGGNVMNTGLIANLPSKACVEVPCVADRNGVEPLYVGDLPEQCAALNRTNINVQLMTIEAALTGKKDAVYQAAFLDPHTSSELSMDDMVRLCNAMIKAHGDILPRYR